VNPARWRRFPVTLFDCDSTLSAVEGIDELAANPSDQSAVAALTDSAMAGEVPLEDVYGKRLSLLNPTKAQVRSLSLKYKAEVVPEAKETLAALKAEGNENWVISGGLLEPVVEFAWWLGVDAANVRAVVTHYDPLDGVWWTDATSDSRYSTYTDSHLTSSTGKLDVINDAVITVGRRLLVGDGASDLAAASAVDLFVAYAGVIDRAAVTSAAPVVIRCRSLAPVLALALGLERVTALLDSEHTAVARSCLDLIDAGHLHFNDEALARRFHHIGAATDDPISEL